MKVRKLSIGLSFADRTISCFTSSQSSSALLAPPLGMTCVVAPVAKSITLIELGVTTVQVCTVVTPSSIKVIDLATGATTHVIPNGGARRADELCEDVKHEIVLSANDSPIDNFLTFINTETYSIIGSNHKLDGTDPNFKIKLTPTPAGTTNVAADGIEQCKFNPRTGSYYLAVPATVVTTAAGDQAG